MKLLNEALTRIALPAVIHELAEDGMKALPTEIVCGDGTRVVIKLDQGSAHQLDDDKAPITMKTHMNGMMAIMICLKHDMVPPNKRVINSWMAVMHEPVQLVTSPGVHIFGSHYIGKRSKLRDAMDPTLYFKWVLENPGNVVSFVVDSNHLPNGEAWLKNDDMPADLREHIITTVTGPEIKYYIAAEACRLVQENAEKTRRVYEIDLDLFYREDQ